MTLSSSPFAKTFYYGGQEQVSCVMVPSSNSNEKYVSTFTLGTMSFGYFWRAMNIVIYTIVGIVFFDLKLVGVNWVTLLSILVLGIISMWGLGVISAGFQLVIKRKCKCKKCVITRST